MDSEDSRVPVFVDKAALLAATRADGAPRLKHEVMEIEGIGWVQVRELSRWEMIAVFNLAENRIQQDRVAVSFGMVNPAMAEHDVSAWQKSGGNAEIEAVAKKINELSGIGKGADKSDLPGDGGQPDA